MRWGMSSRSRCWNDLQTETLFLPTEGFIGKRREPYALKSRYSVLAYALLRPLNRFGYTREAEIIVGSQ
jgi:hypothetical protein